VDGTELAKALSHIIVEVSTNFTLADILAGTNPGGELRSTAHSPTQPIWTGETDTAGIKWNTSGDPTTYSLTINTLRVPMLGTFYAKDGQGTDATASATATFHVPDTTFDPGPTPIPLPATVWIGALGLVGVGLMKYRRGARA